MVTILWIVSIYLKNASIADLFWGFGFIVTALIYFIYSEGNVFRKSIVLILVSIWGLRLTVHLIRRNWGKGEDFRYQAFRKSYGEKRYWWISFFQTFLLQGILLWIVSVTLLGAQFYGADKNPGILDFAGILLWIIGFIFEAGGDLQLAKFRSDPSNKGKILDTGFWKYTRHPNYFGDSAVWWGYGLFSVSAGSYLPALGSILMTYLIIRISGVKLLEKSLKEKKPGYSEYMKKTSAFLPWFVKK